MAKRGAEAENEDTGSVESANERDMEALRQAEKPAKREKEDDEPALEFAEAGEDDDERDEPAERPSRSERRKNRFREATERAERAERAAAEQAQRLAALEQQVRQGVTQQPQAPQVENQYEQYDAAIGANVREQVWLSNQYNARLAQLNGQMPDAEINEWLDRSNRLKDHEQQLRMTKLALQNGYRPHQQQENPVVSMLRAEFHDVEASPVATAYARAYYLAKKAEGVPEGLVLLKESLAHGREWLANGGGQPARPGKAPKPTKESQSRYTGSAPGASPARSATSAQTGGRTMLPDGISLKEFNRMADKMYPHIKDDGQRRTRYYREVVEPEMRERD